MAKTAESWTWHTYKGPSKKMGICDAIVFRKDATIAQITSATRMVCDERHVKEKVAQRIIEFSALWLGTNFIINFSNYTEGLRVDLKVSTGKNYISFEIDGNGDDLIERSAGTVSPDRLDNENGLFKWNAIETSFVSRNHYDWSSHLDKLLPTIKAAKREKGG